MFCINILNSKNKVPEAPNIGRKTDQPKISRTIRIKERLNTTREDVENYKWLMDDFELL